MKRFLLILPLITLMLGGCASLSYQEIIATGVAGTQTAIIPTAMPSETPAPTVEVIPSDTPFPTVAESLAVATETPAVPSDTPTPEALTVLNGQVGQPIQCSESLIVKVPEAPEFKKDLFEHHAVGTFLILKLDLVNTTPQEIQIWDGDYSLESDVDGTLKTVKPHRAATTYLYIQRGGKLMQDQVEPNVPNWQTNLAFDVDPRSKNWVLVFKPGSEVGQALCECRIDLSTSN